ncbi:Aste57867_1644 [Aphanomyces stellatus]|uniref:Aste57867_1644 protein n=1 Tax=Aphanomyces stellatus TaxID=120398 RepID=A0A485K9X8_9STRA|nr:hypothetical protein As57867_001642 [Aphanomyces stellatus]VFT78857.1 Aste57867_1644 [Aphanomyces stellatus]
MTFSFDDIPNLDSKVAIVTGSSTGMGLVTARELAKKGCHVIMACRSRDKTIAAIAAIAKDAPEAASKLDFMELNLMSLKSVFAFTEAFKARKLPLHLLINNAGILTPPFQLSEDGIESQFATNHVGHQALTMALLPILETSAPSRVVVVSSLAHKMGVGRTGLDLDNINNAAKYSPSAWYGQSKLANVLFARELSRQLRARNVHNVHVNVVHPGLVSTDLGRHTSRLLLWVVSWFMSSADDGAKTQLYVATSPDVIQHNWHGKYFEPTAKLSETNAQGQDEQVGKTLWEFTEKLIAGKTGRQ